MPHSRSIPRAEPRAERICRECDNNEIETEEHFLLKCNNYDPWRNKYNIRPCMAAGELSIHMNQLNGKIYCRDLGPKGEYTKCQIVTAWEVHARARVCWGGGGGGGRYIYITTYVILFLLLVNAI